jgi:Mg-chelatase subunit ChlD
MLPDAWRKRRQGKSMQEIEKTWNMSGYAAEAAKAQALADLERLSFVAHRDALAALPCLATLPVGQQAAWLQTAYDFFAHDRDAGKPFIRQTPAIFAAAAHLDWLWDARAFLRFSRAWAALAGYLEKLPEAYQRFGSGGVPLWFAEGIYWTQTHVDNGKSYFATDLSILAPDYRAEGIAAFLAPARRLFQERKLPLAIFLQGALPVRSLLGEARMHNWARLGADILAAGRARGEAYFALESEESLSFLLTQIPGTALRPLRRRFSVLLSVWLGQTLPLEERICLPKDNLPCAIESDGRRLFLPAVAPSFGYAYLALFHAAGHIVAQSYQQTRIAACFAAVGQTPPPLSPEQAMTWRPLFAHFGARLFRFQVLWDVLEDLRVDFFLSQRLPHYLPRLWAILETTPPPADAAALVFYSWAKGLYRALLAAGAVDKTSDAVTWQSQLLAADFPADFLPLVTKDADLLTSFSLALTLFQDDFFPELTAENYRYAYLPAHSPNAARPVYPLPERLDDEKKPEDTTPGNPYVQKEAQKSKDLPKDAIGNDPDLDIPPEETAGSGGRVGVGIPVPAQVLARAVQRLQPRVGIAYPEWDYRIQDYLPDWAWVQESILSEENPARAQEILLAQQPVLRRLKKALEAQKPTRRQWRRRLSDGEELDMAAVVEYVVEKRHGMAPKPLVYSLRQQQQRELAVLLLADASTSIMGKAKNGVRVIEPLRASLLLFAEALETLGDPFAIAAFASKYHDQVFYYRIKNFAEKLSDTAKAQLAALSGRLASRMGAAIRHACADFRQQSASQRLLLILSDGRPADYDDGGDKRYLHEDTRRACKEALDAGIHPFCITLDAGASEYLPEIFGHGHYLIIENVEQLPSRLPEIYLRLRGSS